LNARRQRLGDKPVCRLNTRRKMSRHSSAFTTGLG